MVEMTETANILHNATAQSLVLLDEIGRGTSTFDGLALAWACAKQLLEKNRSYTLFATHYFELTRLAEEFKQAANVHLDAVEYGNGIVFLHSVEEGPASQSYGLQVAQLAGIPKSVVAAAKRKLVFGGNKPHAIIALVEENAELRRLQMAQERICQSVGLAPEGRKFIPHVTLARLRDADPQALRHFIESHALYRSRKFDVERFVLFSSKPSRGGGPYAVEEAYGPAYA